MSREAEALQHLQKLCDWGWGENAPDMAKQDWQEARTFLTTPKPRRTSRAALRRALLDMGFTDPDQYLSS